MIQSLRLQNFRSYSDAQFEFEPSVNIIVGPNASGKTSLIEALLVLSRGSSYKGQEQDLITFGSAWARLDGVYVGQESRTVKLQVAPDGRINKSFILNDLPRIRLSDQQRLPVVLFEPQHMSMLVGEPTLRREFVDDILTASKQGYGIQLKNYRRVLSQRNSLLKRLYVSRKKEELFVWDLRLSELGGYIHDARVALLQAMNDGIAQQYNAISGKNESVSVQYTTDSTSADYTTSLLATLTNNHDKDMDRGFTGFGPHRDDFVVSLRGHDARTAASRGETRSLLLALKILELKELERATGKKPLLLLDDVFSELDGHRRRALASALKSYQTFITTTDADVVIEHFMETANVIPLAPN